MSNADKPNYRLLSLISGEIFDDSGWIPDPQEAASGLEKPFE
jgi:hypothetical protein